MLFRSPAIAIDQKTTNKNPRSTVGTITEIYDYMRVLFARIGELHCPESGKPISKYTPAQIVKELLSSPEKTKTFIMAKIIVSDVKEAKMELGKLSSQGFQRVSINGDIQLIEEVTKVTKSQLDQLFVIVDRLVIKKGIEKRVTDSVELALKMGEGLITVLVGNKTYIYSDQLLSLVTGEIYKDLEPRNFSFNSPIGACPKCNGLGESKEFDLDSILVDDSLPLFEGAMPLLKHFTFLSRMIESIAEAEKADLSKPFKKLPKKFRDVLINGSTKVYTYKFVSDNSNYSFKKEFLGVQGWLTRKSRETSSERVLKRLEEYMTIQSCTDCEGMRLNLIARNTYFQERTITELSDFSIGELFAFFKKVKLKGEKKVIAEKLLKEITSRLQFLNNVGLDYLTLNRPSGTLSGGESQRIRLATQIGSALSGVLYVLDEPSIGLHQRDNVRLIETLKALRDIGNTVLVVEHDEDTIKEADYIIDLGPGAGVHGGEIVANGTIAKIKKNKSSLTGKYIREEFTIDIPEEIEEASSFINLKGATENNLQDVEISIPHKQLTCITGVSGSGKSTLVHNVLVPAVKYSLANKNKILYKKNNYDEISGLEGIKQVIELDQSPIGRTPNSNPATYTGLFDAIRTLYSKTTESQIRGYKPGRFSFNVKGGRCEHCEGNGVKKIEMHFLPDVYVTCDECQGSRYNNETLSVLYKGKSIADVLAMTIEEAYEFFKNHKKMERILGTLNGVGLGYLTLGQPATTLSGGEAQRLKLSSELSKFTKGHTLYILDEPTTGLHFEDIKVLSNAINQLVDAGNTVVIIEHNLDIIKQANYIIDLGPDGGVRGGEIVYQGPTRGILKKKKSETGKFLKRYF